MARRTEGVLTAVDDPVVVGIVEAVVVIVALAEARVMRNPLETNNIAKRTPLEVAVTVEDLAVDDPSLVAAVVVRHPGTTMNPVEIKKASLVTRARTLKKASKALLKIEPVYLHHLYDEIS